VLISHLLQDGAPFFMNAEQKDWSHPQLFAGLHHTVLLSHQPA
jgi:hypothetical protein